MAYEAKLKSNFQHQTSNFQNALCSFEGVMDNHPIQFIPAVKYSRSISGDNSERDTPVPIPNTEVKPFSADGTWWETAWESRSLPDFPIFLSSSMAEHSAVNRGVTGSSPVWGANLKHDSRLTIVFFVVRPVWT